MPGYYDTRLVALSVFIAVVASYTALDLAARVTSSRGGARYLWLSSGATAKGIGLLSMQQLQANCYLSKPVQFDAFESLVKSINDFWLTKVKLPQPRQKQMGKLP